jgi:transposase-like protein
VFPPITVFWDGTKNWLADGFHRYRAHQKIEAVTIRAQVLEGTLKDAILHSVGANATHGLRRSNEDKRRAVRTLLDDVEWQQWSESEIAKRCGVSRGLVSGVKKELEEHGHLAKKQDSVVTFTRGNKRHGMKVKNIGARLVEPPSTPKPEPVGEVPLVEGVIAILRRIYDEFSALPTTTKVADLIKEQEAPFTGMQASEVSIWFSSLAHLLGGGSVKNYCVRGHFPPIIPLWRGSNDVRQMGSA